MSAPELFRLEADLGPGRTALISPDGLYRYELTRRWKQGPLAVWIMLNPSTADADQDDPTIRRVIDFTNRLDVTAGGIAVVNLFAYRATKPDALLKAADPVGPGNVAAIRHRLEEAPVVIAAWGAWWSAQTHRPARPNVEQMAADAGRPLYCLGHTAGGDPRHPLYVRADTKLVPLEARQ